MLPARHVVPEIVFLLVTCHKKKQIKNNWIRDERGMGV
jgi:hypothetical protein